MGVIIVAIALAVSAMVLVVMRGFREYRYYTCLWFPLFFLSGFVTVNALPVFFHDFGGGPEGGFAGMAAGFTLMFTAPFMLLFTVLCINYPPLSAMLQHSKITKRTVSACIILSTLVYVCIARRVDFTVVDQYGESVPNVAMRYHRNSVFAGIQVGGTLYTDSRGKASVKYFAPERIGLSYIRPQHGCEFSGGWRFDRSSSKQPPATIHAWRQGKAAPVYSAYSRRYLQELSGSYTFGYSFESNIIHNTHFEEADVVVTIHNEGRPHGQQRREWDWGVRLDFHGKGGIQVSQDEFPYVAPGKGYRGEIVFEFPPSLGRSWSMSIPGPHRRYYFRTKDGKYGTTGLTAYGYNDGKMFVRFDDISLNYEGGQNLAYVHGSERNRSRPTARTID